MKQFFALSNGLSAFGGSTVKTSSPAPWSLPQFNASEEMLRIGVPALRIIGTHYVFAGFCIIAGSVCQAIGKPVYSLIVSVCRQLVVLLPSAWLLSLTGRLELVWFAFPIAECFSLVLSIIYLSKTMRRAKEKMKDIII